MYEFIKGTVFSTKGNTAVLECNGIGYAILMSQNRICEAGESLGKNVLLYTRVLIRDNDYSIFGFVYEIEREVFGALINVQGIGPKTALYLLGSMSLETMQQEVNANRHCKFSNIKGIGEKTAKRVVLELSPFFGRIYIKHGKESADPGNASDLKNRAISALINLGYQRKEALHSVNRALTIKGAEKSIDLLIRNAIKCI